MYEDVVCRCVCRGVSGDGGVAVFRGVDFDTCYGVCFGKLGAKEFYYECFRVAVPGLVLEFEEGVEEV